MNTEKDYFMIIKPGHIFHKLMINFKLLNTQVSRKWILHERHQHDRTIPTPCPLFTCAVYIYLVNPAKVEKSLSILTQL